MHDVFFSFKQILASLYHQYLPFYSLQDRTHGFRDDMPWCIEACSEVLPKRGEAVKCHSPSFKA